jgi:iron-sulfur cluster repair protein YtfE (RIC family)
MNAPTDAPADTRMMRVVHDALRRDVARARATLADSPSPERVLAVAGHLRWMMGFLHDHHRAEDDGLYPLVRLRQPGASALLDEMAADHAEVGAAVVEVEAAATAIERGDPGAGVESLAAAVEQLSEVLLPHLRREEDEVMPLVSTAVSDAEWRALERQYQLEPRSFRELGRAGHWLLDGSSPDDRRAVLGLVAPMPRFVLLHAFARSYRRRAGACWGGTDWRRVQKAGRCEVRVDAPIDAVWDLVRDVTRIGEWSHECAGAAWLDGATSAQTGARFRGRNRAGIFRWARRCEIDTAEPFALVWHTIPTWRYPDSTRWVIRLEPDGAGTRIEQTFTVLRAPAVVDAVYARMIPMHRDRTAALTEDLRRLGAVAGSSEAAVATASTVVQ